MVNDQAYKITSITDGDIKSGWSNNGNTSLLFEVKPENNKFANIALKKMRIYTSNKNIETVTLKGIANTNYYRNVNVNENGMINDLAGDFKPGKVIKMGIILKLIPVIYLWEIYLF